MLVFVKSKRVESVHFGIGVDKKLSFGGVLESAKCSDGLKSH